MALFPKDKKRKTEVPNKAASARVQKAGSLAPVTVLEQPHVTEKSVRLGEARTYVFRVRKEANKYQVKEAVESVYGVNVESVRMAAPRNKQIRRRAGMGLKRGYKKAMVTVRPDQKIDIATI